MAILVLEPRRMDIIVQTAAGALAILGALSIYFGYRLFCHSRRWSTLVAGAILALLGVGLLVADVRRPVVDHSRPGWQRQLKLNRNAHRYPELFV